MQDALRAEGIDAEIIAVPSYPNLVNRWYELDFDYSLVTDRELEHGLYDQVADHVEILKLPADFPPPIWLKVGRSAQPDETYADATGVNELLPDGALRCLHLQELAPPEAAEVLARYHYDVIWVYGEAEHSEPPAAGSIYWAWFRGPELINVSVSLDGSEDLVRSFDDPSGIRGPCDGWDDLGDQPTGLLDPDIPLARRDAPFGGDTCGNAGGLDQDIFGSSFTP